MQEEVRFVHGTHSHIFPAIKRAKALPSQEDMANDRWFAKEGYFASGVEAKEELEVVSAQQYAQHQGIKLHHPQHYRKALLEGHQEGFTFGDHAYPVLIGIKRTKLYGGEGLVSKGSIPLAIFIASMYLKNI